jgi:L-asparagine transporter-like permease
MAKARVSHSENRKEVYKFWLGFFEKVAVLVFAVVILPTFIGQLQYYPALVIIWISFIFALVAAMIYLSRKQWYLPKDKQKSSEEKNL